MIQYSQTRKITCLVVQEDDNDQEKSMIPKTKSSLQRYLRVASLRVHIV